MIKKGLVIFFMFFLLSVPVTAYAKTYTTESDVYSTIRKNLMARTDQFTITMSKEVMDKIGRNTDLIDKATEIDSKSTSKDSDYLKLSVSEWSTNWQWYTSGKTADLRLMVTYKTTLSQEKKLDTELQRILKALKLENKSDYVKVKKIHDYIIKRTAYDQSLQNHSAYNALIDKSAVCDGYSMAAYRLLTDSGVKTRIITGWAGGEAHSWNIVKVNGKWYNLDLTWDDPVTDTGEQVLDYDYFLKNNTDFKNHRRDYEYNTSTFVKKYPITAESYQ